MASIRTELPTYLDLFRPTLRAVETLGGRRKHVRSRRRFLPTSVLPMSRSRTRMTTDQVGSHDRIDWARSYAALSGTLDRPKRGLYMLSPLGREILALPET